MENPSSSGKVIITTCSYVCGARCLLKVRIEDGTITHIGTDDVKEFCLKACIKGVGIVLAAGVSSEIGKLFAQKPLNNLTSYSGTIPRVKQTGGVEGHPHTSRVSKRSNHLLKDYVVQSAFQMGLRGPEPLLQDYKRREAAGQHADVGIGRRFLRMAMCLMRSSQVYLPPKLRSPKVQMQERAGHYLTTWPLLRDKWKKAQAHQAAFAKDQPLGQWHQMVQELYNIKLKL